LNLKSSSTNFLLTTQSQATSSVNKCSSKFISRIIVANFLLKNALSFETQSFSNVFHLKQDCKDFSKSSDVFSPDSTFCTSSYICSTDQIKFINSIAFLGQNQSIHGILSALSHTIER
jgi:hypothetical protein